MNQIPVSLISDSTGHSIQEYVYIVLKSFHEMKAEQVTISCAVVVNDHM